MSAGLGFQTVPLLRQVGAGEDSKADGQRNQRQPDRLFPKNSAKRGHHDAAREKNRYNERMPPEAL